MSAGAGRAISIAQDSGPPKVSLIYTTRRSAASPIRSFSARSSSFSSMRRCSNAADNLARAKIASGFGFWNQTAGFDISQTLIEYSAQAGTYGRAFWVGLLNTLLVAAIGIVLATILGFLVGIARLSQNFLLAKIAAGYVELIRNLPLLLQLLFWYNAVLKALPEMRDSWTLPGGIFLNNRGLFMPAADLPAGHAVRCRRPGRRHRRRDRVRDLGAQAAGAHRPAGAGRSGGARPGHRAAGHRVLRSPACRRRSTIPEKGRFNIRGGIEILPEFVALLFGLVALYRRLHRRGGARRHPGGVEGPDRGGECAGLAHRPDAAKLVVVPQAMRVIIPPLTSQYLNLTKNSTLAVAVGYPGPGAGLHRHGAQPDRPGGRGRGDHHGGLSHDQPRHLDGDELVQRAHGDGGAVKPWRSQRKTA